MSTELGLRERKKRQTRALIAETARRLFAERGFDEEVAEVTARAARLIGASPALQRREREIVAHATDALAALIAEETAARADGVEPHFPQKGGPHD